MDGDKKFDLRVFLNAHGYQTISSDWDTNVQNWKSWYKGHVDKFHDYNIYNGNETIGCHRKTLAMAKKVCEDKADLLLNEKVAISVTSTGVISKISKVVDKITGKIKVDPLQQIVNDVLKSNNFWVQGNNLIELTAALGTGAFVEYLDSGAINIDYITADCIYPLSWNNGEITECAFASKINLRNLNGYYVSVHVKENGKYSVHNYLLDDEGKEQPLPENLLPVWNTKSEKPMFQIVKLNICNNIDYTCPMGISLLQNSIDTLKAIDTCFDSYVNEFITGRKRIFIDDTMLKISIEEGGAFKQRFDSRDTVFYGADLGGDKGTEHIKEVNMTLRSAEHETALQSFLNMLSSKCGFGKGYYKNDADGVQTATGVISQNSQLYRNIKKDEIPLEKNLIDLVEAIIFLSGKGNADISINFDDSIIEDTDAVAKRAMLEQSSGLIDDVEYFQRVYKLTPEAAQAKHDEIAKRTAQEPSPPDLLNENPNDGTTPANVDPTEVQQVAQQATGERLNGAQVKSLMEVIAQYTANALSENAATSLIVSAFGMTDAEARKLLGLGDGA